MPEKVLEVIFQWQDGCKISFFMHKSKSVLRQWHPTQIESDVMPSVKSLTKTKNEPGKRASRRSSMLNKMFMKNITDLMSTGTVSMDVVGRGIEVSKVVKIGTFFYYYLSLIRKFYFLHDQSIMIRKFPIESDYYVNVSFFIS